METAAIALALYSSDTAKYIPSGNKIILKSPFEEKEEFNLDSKLEGKPVILKWKPEAGTVEKNFHMASPCYLSNFDVAKNNFLCEKYVYDPSQDRQHAPIQIV